MSPDVYRDTETLTGDGQIAFTVDCAGGALERLAIRFSPGAEGIRVEVADTGVSDYREVRGLLSRARFAAMLAAVRAIAVPETSDDGNYDCGTHGCWIHEASVELPLSGGTLQRVARLAEGFSSQELLDRMIEVIDELAREPSSEAVSWELLQRRRAMRRWRVLMVAGVVLLALVVIVLRR